MKSSFIELEGGRQKRRLIQYLDVKVTMESRNHTEPVTEELLENVDISKFMNDNYESIVLSQLLAHLQLNYNIPLENREIYYYHDEGEVFINCGINPLGNEIRIDLTEIDTKQPLQIKIKNLGLLHIDRFMYTQTTVVNIQNDKDQNSQEEIAEVKGKRSRRTKERRIGHIIEKVIEWRKYYSGTLEHSMQHQKYSLQQAANKVGISKKSLDDYLFQIRFGNRYKFNFNEHYNQKVGILRDFVRQQKKATNKGEIKKRKRNNADTTSLKADND